MSENLKGLFFDCDGVIAETERDGHRPAFNQAFAEKGLDLEWNETRYGELLSTGGGKERLRRHFDETQWPPMENEAEAEREGFIAGLHALKTDLFMGIIRDGGISPRPGVLRLMDEALDANVKIAICSTAAERSVHAIAETLLEPERAAHIAIFAGDMVAKKKPDPAVYLLALETLRLKPQECIVIEDSTIGLRAALSAKIACIVTPSIYTKNEDFTGAARVAGDLDHGENGEIHLQDIPPGTNI